MTGLSCLTDLTGLTGLTGLRSIGSSEVEYVTCHVSDLNVSKW